MLEHLISELDPHDAALTAAAIRRQAAIFDDALVLGVELLHLLESRAGERPPPVPPAAAVVDITVERARRRPVRAVVEGQASPFRPVRQRDAVLMSELRWRGLPR